jgi:DNA primase
MPIPDDLIEQVRDTADIVGIIGDHVELRRTGSDYRGPCPFHGGTKRNFSVIPKKQMFYCFVCHEAGDVFTFFMKQFGMEYPTAVREVALKCGITIPDRPVGGPDPREPLYSALSVATDWYARRLQDGDDGARAREYLRERGFDLEPLAPWSLGWAPKGEEFLKGMETLGINADVQLESGIAVKREDGSLRPRFWNRLLFPIHDLRGRPVAFGGRLLGDGEPKYLNSSDNPIFHKGRLLYNMHTAKHAIRKAERAVVVEGYFDVIRLAGVGCEEVVAPLGTALTEDQASLLRRYTQNVTLFYDSDAAGLRASFRAADVLLKVGMRVLIATPPEGVDPDDLAREGGIEGVTTVLDDALDVLERKLQLLDRKGWLGTIDGRRRALDRLLPTLRAVSDDVTRDLYIGRAAEALGVSTASVAQEAVGRRYNPEPRPHVEPVASSGDLNRRGPERDLLRVVVHEPAVRTSVAARLAEIPGHTGALAELLSFVARSDPEASEGDLLRQVDGEARTLLATLLAEPWGAVDSNAIIEGAFGKLESRELVLRVEAIDRAIPVASESEKLKLTIEKDVLSRKIARLNPSRWRVIQKRAKQF